MLFRLYFALINLENIKDFTGIKDMKASDILVKCLEEEGVEYIFGVPGEENADFLVSLQKSKKIQFILTRHEQGAAFMAESYGRLTRKTGVCLGTLGPGATNLITGVADSNMDRVPMLVITGQGSSKRLHKESHQILDIVNLFRPITKWTTSILHQDNIPEIVRKAIRLSRTEKPGATHIELPEDIAKLNTASKPIKPVKPLRPVGSPKEIASVFSALQKSKRPVILAGYGCARKRANKELRALCEKTGIGVISTFMAKGCVSLDAEYCLFTIGLGAKDLIACALDAADLVITIGYDLVEYRPILWNPEGNKKIAHIDFLPAEIDSHYSPEIEVVGDIASVLMMLTDLVDKNGGLTVDTRQQLATRNAMLKELAQYNEDDQEGCIRPQKVLHDTRELMGKDDILFSDVGAHKMWIARHYHSYEPNTCIIPNGFCSMGFALPAAISASLIFPERKILAICGDAGFLMNVQEMETAKRLNSNIVAMVWEDNAYGLIAWKQEVEFGQHTDVSFGNPNWKELAKSFGWNGHFVDKSANLKAALQQAFNEKGPSLIVVPIDYRENMILTKHLGEIVCPI